MDQKDFVRTKYKGRIECWLLRLRLGDFDSTATQVEKLFAGASDLLQKVLTQPINHEATVTLHLNQTSVFQNLQVVRHGHHFRLKKFGDVAHSHLAMAQNVDDP